jgi:hypothetical protein
MRASELHVVMCYSNPMRWQSRLRLYRETEQHVLDSGAQLTTVDCATGDRPWDVSDGPDHSPHVNYIQVRADGGALVWTKENLINIGIHQGVPAHAKYVCWHDADVIHRRADWARETVEALQHYPIMQPWELCLDLGPKGEILNNGCAWHSFCSQHWRRKPMSVTNRKMGHGMPGYEYAHTGYCWAARLDTLNKLGLLIETAALGAGDHHMAWALVGRADWTIPTFVTPGYRRPIKLWEERALRAINQNIGFLHGFTIEHQWHGRKSERGYVERWKIFERNGFDPDTDLRRNDWGVLELDDAKKPQLRHDLDMYFRLRNEDANVV